MKQIIFKHCVGFEWDKGNLYKNHEKHSISNSECEEVFFNVPLLVYEDEKHSSIEKRRFLLGKTDIDKHLLIVFTIRNNLVRVISARKMNKKERKIYENAKKNPEI